MLACATGGFAECNMFVDCTSALGTSPTQNYAFSFECAPGTEGITTGTAAWGCTDIDECATNTCPIGRCVERPLNNWQAPGFDCDTTECGVTDDCVTSAQCVEGTGTGDFVCVCAAGFEGDGKSTGTGCADIDECATQNDTCDVNATCTNSAGAFDCACNAGFAGVGQTCAPVVEMDAGMDMDTPDMDPSDMAPADVGMADLGSDVGEADTGATDLGGAVDMGTDTFVFTEVTPRQVGPTTNPTRSQSGSLTGDGCASASGGASWLLLLIGLGLLRRR